MACNFQQEHVSAVLNQIETSNNYLGNLVEEGTEQVTNIEVANDLREIKRQTDEANAKTFQLQCLEEEALEAIKRYEEINSKWSKRLQLNDALDIHNLCEQQREKCAELILRKNNIIDLLKTELSVSDTHYAVDQKYHSEDINLLIQRIDKQVHVMKHAYRKQLDLISSTINKEQTDIMNKMHANWEEIYNEERNKEENDQQVRFETVQQYEDKISGIKSEYYKEYRSTKTKLDLDLQVLQIELQQTKTTCIINKEKLDYNYQLLCKRKEEYANLKSQQKNRINWLQEVLCKLREKKTETKNLIYYDKKNIKEKINTLEKSNEDAQNKIRYFSSVNGRQFMDIWKLNYNRANSILDKILKIDKLLYEQELDVKWDSPKIFLLPITNLSSYKVIENQLNNVQREISDSDFKSVLDKGHNVEEFILKNIAENSNFLLEDKLNILMRQFSADDQILIKVDNVLQILKVNSRDELETMKKYFLPFIECSTCKSDGVDMIKIIYKKDRNVTKRPKSLPTQRSTLDKSKTQYMNIIQHITSPIAIGRPYSSPSAFANKKLEKDAEICGNFVCDDPTHSLYIKKCSIFEAISQYLKDSKKNLSNQNKSETSYLEKIKPYYIVSRNLTQSDIEMYWAQFRYLFPTERIKIWDALLLSFNKYQNLLRSRQKVKEELDFIKQQNNELTQLLQHMTSTKDNGTILPQISVSNIRPFSFVSSQKNNILSFDATM